MMSFKLEWPILHGPWRIWRILYPSNFCEKSLQTNMPYPWMHTTRLCTYYYYFFQPFNSTDYKSLRWGKKNKKTSPLAKEKKDKRKDYYKKKKKTNKSITPKRRLIYDQQSFQPSCTFKKHFSEINKKNAWKKYTILDKNTTKFHKSGWVPCRPYPTKKFFIFLQKF